MVRIVLEAFRMWTEQSHSRFQQLRRRQEEGALTEVEQAELALLLQEV
jgi:hypothetical protein